MYGPGTVILGMRRCPLTGTQLVNLPNLTAFGVYAIVTVYPNFSVTSKMLLIVETSSRGVDRALSVCPDAKIVRLKRSD